MSASALNAYLRSVKHKPFEWGVHDCLTFSNGAFKAFHGFGFGDDWLGRYMVDGRLLRRRAMIKEFGFDNFECAVDERLQRYDGVPPKGALVTTKHARVWLLGQAMGICVGNKAAFVTDWGMVYSPLQAVYNCWVPK